MLGSSEHEGTLQQNPGAAGDLASCDAQPESIIHTYYIAIWNQILAFKYEF